MAMIADMSYLHMALNMVIMGVKSKTCKNADMLEKMACKITKWLKHLAKLSFLSNLLAIWLASGTPESIQFGLKTVIVYFLLYYNEIR